MEKKNIAFELLVFQNEEELHPEESTLLKQAEIARQTSHSPYSKFRVGAALLLENGKMILGSNQENAAFPAGLCAEGVAIFHAGANHPDQVIKTIAITAASQDYVLSNPAAPCGVCRQAIAEYEQKQQKPIAIIMRGQTGPIYKCSSILDLLPLGFDNSFLKES